MRVWDGETYQETLRFFTIQRDNGTVMAFEVVFVEGKGEREREKDRQSKRRILRVVGDLEKGSPGTSVGPSQVSCVSRIKTKGTQIQRTEITLY